MATKKNTEKPAPAPAVESEEITAPAEQEAAPEKKVTVKMQASLSHCDLGILQAGTVRQLPESLAASYIENGFAVLND